ncbi:MAG: sigma-70 family RNA polymerase sigma factor [Planctomycetota bacterium]
MTQDADSFAAQTSLHLRRARSGDDRSLEWIVERFSPLVLLQIKQRFSPRVAALDEAEDLAQEVWARVLPGLSGLPATEDGRFTPVLVRRLKNEGLEALRRRFRSRLAPIRSTEGLDELAPDAASRETVRRALGRESVREVLDFIAASFSDEERELLTGRLIERRPYADLATETGIPEATLRKRCERVLARLRERFAAAIFDEL